METLSRTVNQALSAAGEKVRAALSGAADEFSREQMNIVIVGHVDHGKSTVIGRLLADTGSLPEGKLEAIRAYCARNAKPFEYAFLLDALKDEQAQGITIDTARIFFKSKRRDYIIIDAPGHIEFLKNMVTGAARAEAALLVIDAKEGIQENSRRHGFLLSMLGIKQVAVLVNKMDLVGYDEAVFERIRRDYTEFLRRVEIEPRAFIPVAAFAGENIASASEKMPWYGKAQGLPVLGTIDLFSKEAEKSKKPFRMPVQDVYKFTAMGDDRRLVAGRVESGRAQVGDEVVFLPSNKRSRIKSIEVFSAPESDAVEAGVSTGFTLAEQIYIGRGELMVKASEPQPKVGKRLRTNLFWMGKRPMEAGKNYFLKLGTAKIGARLAQVNHVIDAGGNLGNAVKNKVERHDVADVVLELQKPLAFDAISDLESTGRFVIVDQYEIAGGGIVREALADEEEGLRREIARREFKFERSSISAEKRAERLNQKATLIVVTGEEGTDRKGLGKALEERLFEMGRYVYYVAMGNLLYSVDADLKDREAGFESEAEALGSAALADPKARDRSEHLRRLGELAYLMLDAGMLLVVSARDLDTQDLQALEALIAPHPLLTVCLGGCPVEPERESMLYCDRGAPLSKCVTQVIDRLSQGRGLS